jgi:hypothetical protein
MNEKLTPAVKTVVERLEAKRVTVTMWKNDLFSLYGKACYEKDTTRYDAEVSQEKARLKQKIDKHDRVIRNITNAIALITNLDERDQTDFDGGL